VRVVTPKHRPRVKPPSLSVVPAILLATLLGFACAGQSGGDSDSVVAVSTFWSQDGIKPGGEINLAVVLEIKKPYHLGANTAKDPFIPTEVQLIGAPEEVRGTTALYPEPELVDFDAGDGKQKIPVFSGRTTIFMTLSAASSAKPGERPVQLRIQVQACDDRVCLRPADLTNTVSLRVLEASARPSETNAEIFAAMKSYKRGLQVSLFGLDFSFDPSRLWVLWLVAAIGGMLLNFTPCVLPLIPIKIMSLSRAAGNRRRSLLLGLLLSLGVVAFWLALAVAITTVSGFNAANQLFQYPAFTIIVGLVICAMAIGMCGFFSVRLPNWIYSINPSEESLGGSFGFGIMTAVLSTPCTAPLMGAAAAWATTQAPAITLSTFAAIGGGMALPYLVLSAFPGLVKRMPRAGPASELIKQVMGLLLLAAGAYFLGTGTTGILAKPPDPPSNLYWWFVVVFVVAAGGWLAWRSWHITTKPGWRILFAAIGLLLISGSLAGGAKLTRGSPIHWVYYTPERFTEAQRSGKVIVLEFTAAWCLNCHALEQAVLHQPRVVAVLNSKHVVPMKVDLTGNNVAGSKKLVESGRRTIPYLVVYAPDQKEVFASDAYTVDQIVGAVSQAQGADPKPGL
jgi:thiol:disulfide interchange protein DsbD